MSSGLLGESLGWKCFGSVQPHWSCNSMTVTLSWAGRRGLLHILPQQGSLTESAAKSVPLQPTGECKSIKSFTESSLWPQLTWYPLNQSLKWAIVSGAVQIPSTNAYAFSTFYPFLFPTALPETHKTPRHGPWGQHWDGGWPGAMPQTTYMIQLSRTALAHLAERWGRAEHGHLWHDPAQGHRTTLGEEMDVASAPRNLAEGHIMGHLGLFVVCYFQWSPWTWVSLSIPTSSSVKWGWAYKYESHGWKNLVKTTAAVPSGKICKFSNYCIFSYDYHLLHLWYPWKLMVVIH